MRSVQGYSLCAPASSEKMPAPHPIALGRSRQSQSCPEVCSLPRIHDKSTNEQEPLTPDCLGSSEGRDEYIDILMHSLRTIVPVEPI
jgi:hypothetical protein